MRYKIMRNILIVGFLLSALFSYSQIPATNLLIIQEADSYIDQKVGTGVCKELLDTILIHNGLGQHIDGSVGYYSYMLDSLDTIYPGDVILFKNVVLDFGDVQSTYEDHLAIVYFVMGDGSYYIIHQNHGVENLEDSKVVVSKLDLNKMVGGEIKFVRPIHL